MFTGIVEGIGTIQRIERSTDGARLSVDAGRLDMADAAEGESVAVAGCCLTITGLTGTGFAADVSGETLHRTTLGGLESGARVNLERALRAGDRLGGHLVTGHVDGVGEVLSLQDAGDSRRLELGLPAKLAQYVAEKGSLTVDGVSLTVNGAGRDRCHANLVPHTLSVTTLGELGRGDRVNLEVDLVARYLARLVEFHGPR